MHPIERLRYVARSAGGGAADVAVDAAAALSAMAFDVDGLVTGCRQLVDRHPWSGPLWFLCARALTSSDPGTEVWAVASELEADATADVLRTALPTEAAVTVIGWCEPVLRAMERRGDVRWLTVDALGDGDGEVRPSGLGAAAAASDIVLIEATAVGPDAALACSGALAAAAVARATGRAVWMAAGVGRLMPRSMWDALARRVDDAGEAWERRDEVVPLHLVDTIVGPWGALAPADAVRNTDCPAAPELAKSVFAPGSR